ncbi:low temperature requirement protein A [Herbaspirillum robiniae]|uniref:low temperature requirement protein A n=1 Tax=Herbaspirillum robiniae TaxID=2014887 RepID=UPI003D77D629
MNRPSHPQHHHRSASLLRVRDGHEARVSFVELFFDLIYVFAVTQLSHNLLEKLTPEGAIQTLVLWFAVWLAWQYTAWVTNWFDPEALPIRSLLFAIMLVGLVMAAALPEAFGERGLVFAVAYAAIQVGRTLAVLASLQRGHELAANFRRMLGWLSISAVLWIAGGLLPQYRLGLWIAAVACEYVSPMTGFWLPGLGRSRTDDWTIEGGHLAERCQLFVIVALGETLLMTGATLAHAHEWEIPVLIAFAVTFLGAVAMWWMYFDTSSKDGSEAIVEADDPGRIGAYFHYVHVAIVAGVILCAVGNELVIAHPDQRIDGLHAAMLILGPAIYVLGNGIYKQVVYGRFPLSHVAGLVLLAILAPASFFTDLLMVSGLSTAVLVLVAGWEACSRRAVHMAYLDEHAADF